MIRKLLSILKSKLAKDEIQELYHLKQRINYLKDWCSDNKDVSMAAQ